MTSKSSQGLKKNQREFAKDIEFLSDVIDRVRASDTRRKLMNYREQTLPYFVPRFFVQSKRIAERRKCNLIGGFPYTSAEYPWPIDVASGQHLQPIAQIDLEHVGSLLKDDFGSGLLQVWGYDAQSYGLLQAEHRIVPKLALGQAVDTFLPPEVACAMEFGVKIKARPLVQWNYAADMFMGTMEYASSVCDDLRDDGFVHVQLDNEVDGDEAIEELPSRHDALPTEFEIDLSDLSLSLLSVPYFGTYLGGYGGDYGSRGSFLNVNPEKGRLLIRIGSDEDDSNLGVIVRKNVDGSPTFEIECCYS